MIPRIRASGNLGELPLLDGPNYFGLQRKPLPGLVYLIICRVRAAHFFDADLPPQTGLIKAFPIGFR
jgi:hypothetical protein